ncbi:MAG: ACT domain-containing protein [Clostridia bacterium]|nr:ACT domain-containing protein [Clostridia bacterium]
MTIETLGFDLTVCKVASFARINTSAEFFFIGKTDKEISLVCRTQDVPPDTLAREDGWRAFRVAGVLDFSLTGVLSGITGVLAGAGVGVFAVSTYDTDYILVKRGDAGKAADALSRAGYEIRA